MIIAKLFIYQKKALGELYRALPLSSRTSNVCISYAHFNFFPYKFQLNENAKALCLYCTDLKYTNIFVKVIQWDKLWYDFPVFTVSHYGEQAVSFKMVDLPKSLPLWEGFMQKSKRVNTYNFWLFGMNIITTCQCTGKLHISYDCRINLMCIALTVPKKYVNPHSTDSMAMTPLLCTVNRYVPHHL